eukprot:scaffold196406_cov35-Attheya_sp.AAC.1
MSDSCLLHMYVCYKATKKKWRDKTRKNEDEPEKVTKPGQVVSVDQMVSPTPGLIAQMTGILTTKRYTYATVFVDQYSRFSYVHLQKTATAVETIEAKKAFERYAKDSGIMIRAYHADIMVSSEQMIGLLHVEDKPKRLPLQQFWRSSSKWIS